MHLFLMEYVVRLGFLFVLGTILGSMLNVCIYRLPLHEEFWPAIRNLFYPPSRCGKCGTRIPFYDNIPVLGWLKLRGKCRFCRCPIPFRYAGVELLTGVLFVVVYWFEIPYSGYYDLSKSCLYHPLGPQGIPGSDWLSPTAMQHWRYAFHMVMILGLIVATFIDWDHRIIPDSVTLPVMTVGLLGNWLIGQVHIVPVWFQVPRTMFLTDLLPLPPWLASWFRLPRNVPDWIIQHPHWHGLALSVAGILIGGGVVWAVRQVGFWVLKREAMGFGDVVLLAMIGSFVGWQATLVIFFIAPACALIFAVAARLLWREREIPYGPYLSVAALLLLLFWPQIWTPAEQRIFVMGPLLPVAGLFMLATLSLLLVISRFLQRQLGWNVDDETEELFLWRSADQLTYSAGENVHDRQGRWPQERWPGTLASRGQWHEAQWRQSSPPRNTPPGHQWRNTSR